MPERASVPVLHGLRVLDLAHQFAGSFAACLLADLGAEVITVENPAGGPLRTMLPQKQAQSLWWKAMGRGKRVMTLDLRTERGRELAIALARRSDAIVENFRPGTLERWGLGPDQLEQGGVSAVMLRLSGFGQTGPYSRRPGYGTIAEAMSGFAHLNGEPDGPPMFPSATLADGTSGLFGAFGVLAAVHDRLRRPQEGVQVVDVALYESLFRLIPTQMLVYDQLGEVPCRPGNFLGSHGVLRNLYRCVDGVYFVVSAIGDAPIRRILQAAGAEELQAVLADALDPASSRDFHQFLVDSDAAVAAWARTRTWDEVSAALASTDAVFQRVFTIEDIAADPQYEARGDIQAVPDDQLGPIRMPAPFPKFHGREHVVAHAGLEKGHDTEAILGDELGLGPDEIAALRQEGVV